MAARHLEKRIGRRCVKLEGESNARNDEEAEDYAEAQTNTGGCKEEDGNTPSHASKLRLMARGKTPSKPTPTNPKLYARVKAEAKKKFDVYPSAYANAWLVRTYKSRGGGYRGKRPT